LDISSSSSAVAGGAGKTLTDAARAVPAGQPRLATQALERAVVMGISKLASESSTLRRTHVFAGAPAEGMA
jgi:hypothetical protein